MTDLPFGRGGSPLQNLLLREICETQMSALRVVEAMDAGPIYLKHPFSLHGSAEEIYARAADLVFRMIDEILENQPTPVPQQGEVVEFKRRAAAESEIPTRNSLTALYDFIRMLDAEGYPAAFLSHEGFRYEFSHATLRDGHIAADVKIFPVEK
jgi:methionyl-tRNA formyltransferase